MTQVHHPLYGLGEIVAEDVVRGRRQYKVAGAGFEVWMPQEQIRLAAADVDFDHSVSLPYNPTPQHPAIPGATESTIQPNHSIDVDELLHPADSVTFNDRTESEGGPWPKPNPALFAASLMRLGAEDEDEEPDSDSGDSDSAPPFGGSDDDSDSDEESSEDDGEEPSTPPDNFGPSEGKTDSDESSPADDQGGEPDTDDQGSADEIPEDYLEHPLIELVQEAQMMLQEHPDWAQRPVGDIIDEQTGGGGEQGPPEQGGLPPELGGGGGGLPPELGGGGPSPEELGAKLSMILGRAMYYSDPAREMAMIRQASALHQAGFEREAWQMLPALALRALPLIQKAWPFIQKALPSLAGSFAGHQLAEGGGGGGTGGGGADLGGQESVEQGQQLQPQESQEPASAGGGMGGFQLPPGILTGGGFGRQGSAFNERLAWGQAGQMALKALIPLVMGSGVPGGGNQDNQKRHKSPLRLWDLDSNGGSSGGGAGWGGLTNLNASVQRPAGLSDRYIEIESSADYHNDPIVQFRHDPDAFISRTGHVQDEGLNPRFAEYVALVEADHHIREAAWKDVRTKALRLRRDGQVHVNDIGPDRIHATVQGDHGIYETMITKGGSFGGLNGGHGISNWHCGCEWGKWAFRRKYSYVGRLCSHGYAAYLEMQSSHTKGKPRMKRQTQPPKRTKKADALQLVPTRLVPEMVVNDTDDAAQHHPETIDVTKDERITTGPGGIVADKEIKHFTSMLAMCERTGAAYPRELVAYLVKRSANPADDDSVGHEEKKVKGWGDLNYFDPNSAARQNWNAITETPGAGQQLGEILQGDITPGYSVRNPLGGGGWGQDPFVAEAPNEGAPNTGTNTGGKPDAIHTQPTAPNHDYTPHNNPDWAAPFAEKNAEGFKNSIGGEGDFAKGGHEFGQGLGYGGAGFQEGKGTSGQWLPSKETTHIGPGEYEVKSGDTGQNIADRAGVSLEQLGKPKSGDIGLITPGEKFKIPEGGKPSSTGKPGLQPGATPPGATPTTTINTPASGPATTTTTTPNDAAANQAAENEGDSPIDWKKAGSRKLEAYFSQYYGAPVRYAAAPPPGTRKLEAYFSRYYGRPITAAEGAEGEEPDPLVEGDQDGSPGSGEAGTDTLNPTPKASAPVPGVNSLGTSTADTKGTAEVDAKDAADKAAVEKTDAEKAKDKEEDKQTDIGNTDPTSLVNQGPNGNNMDVGQAGGLDLGSMSGMIGDIGSAVAPAIGAGISALPELASGLSGAMSGMSDMGGGLASGLSSALSGLGGIFGHKLAAGPFRPGEHEPFAGSGPQPPLTIHPSSEHMEGIDYEDVTDLGSYDLYQRHEAARWFEADDNGTAQGTTSGQDTGGQSQGMRDPSANSFTPTPGAAPATPAAGTAQPGTASGMAAPVPPITPGTQPLLSASLHYAEGIDTQADWEADDATDADAELTKLRNWAQDGQEEFLGDMDQHIQEVQDTVQQAHEHGVDASQLVASRGGIKRVGKPRQRPAVVPEVVRVYGGNGNGGVQTVANVEDHDPYSKTASDFDADAPDFSGGGDIVAQFQRSAAAQEIMATSGGNDDFDISGAAMAHIKTAGRNFSIAEQHELMNERHPKGARNLASLDLEGTHYEAENSVGLF